MTQPLVSAVIPTRNRPDLVLRAVKTVLSQTYPNVEAVVVVDGPDYETVRTLEALQDPRVRVIALTENVGGSEARNTGVREAKGEWIALLDDDDEWLPEKIARQMAAAEGLTAKNIIISCQYIERSVEKSAVLPARLPDPGESVDSYLLCPRGFRTNGEVLQTSTLLVPRELMLAVPFIRGLKRGQDFMWMIHAGSLGKATMHVVPEVLSIFNSEGFTDTRRVSSKPKWESFYECVRANRAQFTPRGYSYCMAARILTDVIKCKEPFSVKLRLLGECLSTGPASLKPALVFLYVWMVPPDTRVKLGESLRGKGKPMKTGSSQVGTA